MIKKITALIAWPVAAVLLIFTARRWLFMLLALKADPPAPPSAPDQPLPPVLLLTPARNETDTLPGLFPALANLHYPCPQLTVVFINDGSTDATEAVIRRAAAGHENWHTLSLPHNVGKAQALNLALAAYPQGQLVAIYDADERPRPDALRRLVDQFADPCLGGVSGQRAIANPLNSPAAAYTTFEGLVHQLVTMRAKNRLNLAPAVLGSNCVYRRAALAEIGGFKSGALLEDTDVTLRLARAGWRTRFEPAAVSYHRVPQTIAGYWRQHTRWARGFNEVAKEQAQSILFDHRLPWPLRLELLAFSLGYLDRLALLAGASWLVVTRQKWPLGWVIPLSLVTPLLQILTALKAGRCPKSMWGRVGWVPFFFLLDIAMALTGVWKTVAQSQKIWEVRQRRR